MAEVEEEFGRSCSSISKCLKKSNPKRRTAYNCIWMYVEDYIEWDVNLEYYQTNKSSLYKGKPVLQLNEYGELINTFKSGKEAESKTGIKAQNINFSCKNPSRTAGGFYWRYA